jgi:hypothetical protein
MRICKIDKSEQVWGRGGPAGFSLGNAAAAAAGAAGAAAGSATPASSAGSAVVGGVAGMAAGSLGGPAASAVVSGYVTSAMDTYNSNNPTTATTGITITDTACLNPAHQTNSTPSDPAGNSQGGTPVSYYDGPGGDGGGDTTTASNTGGGYSGNGVGGHSYG